MERKNITCIIIAIILILQVSFLSACADEIEAPTPTEISDSSSNTYTMRGTYTFIKSG